MKTFAICLLVLMVTVLLGLGFYHFSPMGVAEAKVLDLMKQFHQAEKNRDEGKLNQILANEISWSRYKAQRIFTKEHFIENIKNTQWKTESTEATFVTTEIRDKQMKVFFTMQQKAVSTSNNVSEHHGNYIYTFENQNNEWKLTTIHLEN